MLFGICGLIIWMIQLSIYAINGRIRFIFPYWFVVADKRKRSQDKLSRLKAYKQKHHKPEWWRFLTEETIDSLMKKHLKRK